MNDLEKALARIKRGIQLAVDAKLEEAIKELTTTKEALEKQIPKEPEYTDEDLRYFDCPTCKESIYTSDEFSSYKYCLNCGQAIDWSMNDE